MYWQEITGASIVTALASSLCNPAVWALPHVYVRAGSLLLVRRHHTSFCHYSLLFNTIITSLNNNYMPIKKNK